MLLITSTAFVCEGEDILLKSVTMRSFFILQGVRQLLDFAESVYFRRPITVHCGAIIKIAIVFGLREDTGGSFQVFFEADEIDSPRTGKDCFGRKRKMEKMLLRRLGNCGWLAWAHGKGR